MRFVAIDVETANPNMSSICQIGLVRFEDGRETAAEAALIDPTTWFDPYNIQIHGITEASVRGAKRFVELHDWICEWTAGETLVCHTHFDRVAVAQACKHHDVASLSCTWLDSARVTRRAWPQFATSGYGLANIARHFGIEFQHHDALHDARTAGLVLLRAIEHSGQTLANWQHRASRPMSGGRSARRTGDGDGGLQDEVVVFTGALEIPRRDAADRAAMAGADVQPRVTRATTMLVVGDQDIAKLNGHEKAANMRRLRL